jgi:uroporphyrinogen III methyltransferase/synthase
VYLVGAGPGDPELLTLKGRRALREAQVVVYDRLANERLLEHAPAAAERIYVGKEAGGGTTQEEINAILVEKGSAGLTVCRLKGGDPFVFGRGGEEAESLAAAGVPWEYVPGITSAISVPGYAGIPVTHRGLCATLAIVTAHEDPTKGKSTVRWKALVDAADTLVVLMGAERLPRIVQRLVEHGRSPDTPAAVVSWGTYSRQQTVVGTLADLEARCEASGCTAPAIIVVGEVATLRERLAWFENRPLFGRRIVVTRATDQASELTERIEAAGGEAVQCPTIRVQPLPHPDLSGFSRPYNWVVFTSTNGVYCLASALRETGRDFRMLGSARIAAIGSETARAVQAAGLWVDFAPSRFVAEQVIAEFPEPVAGTRILLPRAREAREILPELWRAAGAEVEILPVYETVPEVSQSASRLLEAGTIDAITFTASSTVRNFSDFYPAPLFTERLSHVRIVCIGPATAATAQELGFPIHAIAEPHTINGLVVALERLFAAEPV